MRISTVVVASQPVDMKTSEATSMRMRNSIKTMSDHASADMKKSDIMMTDINRRALVAALNVTIQTDGVADKTAVISTIITTGVVEAAAEEAEQDHLHHKNNRNAANRIRLQSKELPC